MSGDERCTNAAVSSRVWYEYQNGAWTRRESGRTAGVPAEADNGRSVLPRVDPREVPKEFYRGCSYAQAELA